jgi:hypothetical protein
MPNRSETTEDGAIATGTTTFNATPSRMFAVSFINIVSFIIGINWHTCLRQPQPILYVACNRLHKCIATSEYKFQRSMTETQQQ